MEQNQKGRRPSRKKGGIFPFLAVILLIVTLTGLGMKLNSSGAEKALEKTKKILAKKEDDTLSLLALLSKGELSLGDGTNLVLWNGEGADAFSLELKGKADLTLGGKDTYLTAQSKKLLPTAMKTLRSGAAARLTGSAFDGEVPGEEALFFFRTLLAATDPALEKGSAAEALLESAKKAKPLRTKEEGVFTEGGKKGTLLHYTFDSHSLVRLLQTLARKGQKDEVRENAVALTSLLLSASGRSLPADLENTVGEFITGKGALYDEISALAGKSQSSLTFTLFISGGGASGVKADLKLGSYRANLFLDLGEDLKKSASETFTLKVKEGEKTLLQLEAGHAVTDDSEMAFIREWKLSLLDETGVFFEEAGEKNLTLRYSWGREKGDLGLKLITDRGEWTLRGSLDEYKKGSKLLLTVKRVEEGKENILKADALSVSLSRGGKAVELPAANGELLSHGEEKEALAETFRSAYYAAFPESSQ